jgi:hypothetical protein
MIWAGGCSTRRSGFWRPKGLKIATGTIVAAVTIAAVGEILCPQRFLADRGPLTAIGLIAPNTGFLAMQQSGKTRPSATLAGVATTAWISLVRLSTPRCAFMPKYQWLPFFV